MFEKLLANLPYVPGLIKQFGFYKRRLHHEEAVRRVGFILIVLAFVIELAAVIAPPHAKPTNTPSALPVVAVDAAVRQRLGVSNQTQQLTNADHSTVQPDDVVTYTLFATNTGKTTIKDFVMQQDLTDVLDYADIVDLHSGSINDNEQISWPATALLAGSTLTHQVTVRIKNPIPLNNPLPNDPSRFDGHLSSSYGNQTSLSVPASSLSLIARASVGLPNNSAGGLAIAAALVIAAGYFLIRARQLAHESIMLMQQFSGDKPE